MSKRDAAILLEDIRDALAKIRRYVSGMDRIAFLANERTVDAVVRNVEIIREAVKQLPEVSSPPTPMCRGLRSQACGLVSCMTMPVLIWRSSGRLLQESLPELKSQISNI